MEHLTTWILSSSYHNRAIYAKPLSVVDIINVIGGRGGGGTSSSLHEILGIHVHVDRARE